MFKTKNRTFTQPIALIGLLAIALFSCTNSAQKEEVQPVTGDDLKGLVWMNQGDSLKEIGQYDEAISTLDSAISTKANETIKAGSYWSLAMCYSKKEDYYKALEYYLSAINSYKTVKDSGSVAVMQYNAAVMFKTIGMFDKAAKYAIATKNFMESDTNYSRDIASVYNLLGNIHKEIESYDRANFYHKKSLAIREYYPELTTSTAINNIGNVYLAQEKYDSSLMYYQRYNTLAWESGNKKKIGRSFNNIARSYLKLGNKDLSKQYIDSAQAWNTANSYKSLMISLKLIQSDYYLDTDIKQSEQLALSALQESKDLGVQKEKLIAVEKLSDIYSRQNNLKDAFAYAKLYNELRDKVDIEGSANKIHSYERISQLDQKNQEIEELERRRLEVEAERAKRARERNFLIVLFVLIIVITYMLYKRYLEKKKFVEEYFSSDTGVILKTGKKFPFNEIYRVETLRNDLILYTSEGKVVEKSTTLKSFVPSLPKLQFGRPQRGIIVNFSKVEKVLKTKLIYQGETINISPTYGEEFQEQWSNYIASNKS